jgi:D-proline reductase (dithiol) PrdB
VGLVQREVERAGIPTVGISIVRGYTEKVKPPRSIFLRWPFGHPLGEPFNPEQQRAVLLKAFHALYAIERPGDIIDVPFRWRRRDYEGHTHAEGLKKLVCQPAG